MTYKVFSSESLPYLKAVNMFIVPTLGRYYKEAYCVHAVEYFVRLTFCKIVLPKYMLQLNHISYAFRQ